MEKETDIEQLNFRKNFIWNILGSTLSGFSSLFFLIIVKRINGLADAGIFTLAFSIACLFCIIGGYAGRTYQVTDASKQYSDKEYIVHKCLTVLIMMIIAFAYCFVMGYSGDKFIIVILLCLTKAMEVLGDVFLAILQKKGYLYQSGISLTMKSILSIFVFFVIDILFKNLILACISLIIVWLVVMIVYDIPKAMKVIDKKEVYDAKKMSCLFKTGFYSFLVLFLSIYLINAPKYALDGITSEELQGIFGIILMPATIVGLCVQYLLQPFLNNITQAYKEKNKQKFKKIVNYISLGVIILGIICLIGAYVVGIPILNLIYSLHLNSYAIAFIVIMIGAIFYALASLYAAVLTTVRMLKIQTVIYVFVSLFGFFISPILIRNFSINGAAYAYLLIMFILCCLYFITYLVVLKNDKVIFGD